MRDIASHILDLLQNSIRAKATKIDIEISFNKLDNTLYIRITDDGIGIKECDLLHVSDPFFSTRTTRSIGLGLALIKQNAERTGGKLKIISDGINGTEVVCSFHTTHIDCPPLGDIEGAIQLTVNSYPEINFTTKLI